MTQLTDGVIIDYTKKEITPVIDPRFESTATVTEAPVQPILTPQVRPQTTEEAIEEAFSLADMEAEEDNVGMPGVMMPDQFRSHFGSENAAPVFKAISQAVIDHGNSVPKHNPSIESQSQMSVYPYQPVWPAPGTLPPTHPMPLQQPIVTVGTSSGGGLDRLIYEVNIRKRTLEELSVQSDEIKTALKTLDWVLERALSLA